MPQTVDEVYRDYVTPGVPASGDWEPEKPEIRALLKQIQNSGGLAVTRNTLTQLNAVTPPNDLYGGVVLADPNKANNGYYSRVNGVWVRGRGFPDTFAELVGLGGTANNVTATASVGVSPSDVEVYFIQPLLTNTTPVVLNGIPVRNVNGDDLGAGEWSEGRLILLVDRTTEWRLLSDPDADGAAASAAANADIAVQAAADAVGGLGRPFDDIAQAEAYDPDTDPEFIQVASFSTPADGGQMQLTVTPGNVEPDHFAKVMINTGRWFEITPQGRINVKCFGVRGNGSTDDTDRANEAIAFAAGRPLEFPVGVYPITGNGLMLVDTSLMEIYRSGPKIFGQGAGTKFLNNAEGACMYHPVSEAQGANNYFTRGVELAHFQIIGDSGTPAESDGLKILGSYHPWLHDVIINGQTGNAVSAPKPTGWVATDPNPDRYAVADFHIDRCNLSSNIRSGLLVENVACQPKMRGCYIVSNLRAGILASGSVGEVHGNSISGNGTHEEVNTGGIVLVRDEVYGTPQNWHIHHNEIDANWNNQIMLDAFKTVVEYNRFNDDPTWYPESDGEFMAPIQVEIRPSAGSGADDNRIVNNSFRTTNTADKNVTLVAVNLQSPGTRTAKNNVVEGCRKSIFGQTTGVVKEYDEVNGDSVHGSGNRWASIEVPMGAQKVYTTTRDSSLASGSQTISMPFKPSNVHVEALIVNSENYSVGDMGIDKVDNGIYHRAEGYGAHDGLVNMNAAAGVCSATGVATEDGLVLNWVRTGSITGTIQLVITASP